MPPQRLQVFRVFYWGALLGLFAWAGWKRFSLPLDPLADPDTWAYLGPALHKLTGPAFIYEGRNFIYPGFLFLLLRLFGDFRAISVTQHLLGLAAGGLLLITWRRAFAFVTTPFLRRRSHDVLGLVLVAVFLVAGDPIRAEMQIRPEGVCALLLALNLWFAVQFIAGTFVEKRPASVPLGVGLAVSAVLLASLKPSFVFLALVSVLPVGLSFLRPGFVSKKVGLAAGAVSGALLFLLPEHLLSRDHYAARMFLPTTLFVVHADMIRDQMAEDLRREVNLPYPRDWLRRVHAELSEEIAKSRTAVPDRYFSLGFSPDYLMYREDSIAVRLEFEFGEDPGPLAAFYRYYYWRTWRQHPFAMLKKIGRQMAFFYAPLCPAYDRSKFLSLADEYQLVVPSLNRHTYPSVWTHYPPAVEFMKRAEFLAQHAAPIQQRRVVRRALTFLAGTYLPLLATTLIIAVAALCRSHLRRRVGWLATLALFLFAYNAAACLEVAIVNSLEVPRYSTVQLYFTLLAEFLAGWLLLESLLGMRRRAAASSS